MSDFPAVSPGSLFGFRPGEYVGAIGRPSNVGAYTPALGRLFLIPFWVPRVVRFDRIGCKCHGTVASAKLRVGIYGDGGSYWPGSLILDAGQLDMATSSTWQEATIDQTLAAGLYWLAGATQGANPNVSSYTGSADSPYQFMLGWQHSGWDNSATSVYSIWKTGETGALPADASAATMQVGTAVQAQPPRILLRVA